jgi:hypothetical protein
MREYYNYYRETQSCLGSREQNKTKQISLYFLLRRSVNKERPCPNVWCSLIFGPKVRSVFTNLFILILSDQGPATIPFQMLPRHVGWLWTL